MNLAALVLNGHGAGGLLIAILVDGLFALLVFIIAFLLLGAAGVASAKPIAAAVALLVFLILLLG